MNKITIVTKHIHSCPAINNIFYVFRSFCEQCVTKYVLLISSYFTTFPGGWVAGWAAELGKREEVSALKFDPKASSHDNNQI